MDAYLTCLTNLWKEYGLLERRSLRTRTRRRALSSWLRRRKVDCSLSPVEGLGKSSITLAAIKLLKAKGLTKGVLVIAPLRVCHFVWPEEVTKWQEFQDLKVVILHGKNKEQRLLEPADIYLVNYEGLLWLCPILAKARDWPFDWLVCDESSKLKSTQTRRFKALKALLPRFRRRTLLTGSPASKSLEDLFGQMYVCDLGASLGKFITHFRNEFFIQSGFGGYDYALKPGAKEDIYARIQHKVLHLGEKDYLELPPLLEQDIFVELPEKVMRKYLEMENLLFTQIASATVIAANAAVATSKCRQIANGALFLDAQAGTWEELHSAKLDAVEELLDQLGDEPALIIYDFRHDLQRLMAKFPGRVLGGAVSEEQTQLIKDWNAGKVPVMYGHPKSMGHGLNLQAGGANIIWASLTWSFEEYDQTFRRLYRQGQSKPVQVYRIIAKNTVDEGVIDALTRKGKNEEDLLDALKLYWTSKTGG